MTRNLCLIKDQNISIECFPTSFLKNIINLIYCKSDEQITYMFTEAQPKDCFYYLGGLLGVKSLTSLEGSVGVKAPRDDFLKLKSKLWFFFFLFSFLSISK